MGLLPTQSLSDLTDSGPAIVPRVFLKDTLIANSSIAILSRGATSQIFLITSRTCQTSQISLDTP